ncbi:MAG: DNA polymerase IV, partial [Deltaproteobacteria bacterium CG17_big_fil_post_rev_8_21_14_2_50_63_7]
HGYRAAGIRVKLKTAQFELHTRQRRLVEPTDVAKSLYEAALTLLPEFDLSRRFRLVGLAAFDLVEEESRQFELFKAGVQSDEHRRRLDTALDAVHDRFGGLSLRRASELDPER